ncbi:MAG: TPM domain-containing protein [Acidobacteriota bacterium]
MKAHYLKRAVVAAGALSLLSLAAAAGKGLPPSPAQWVTDSTGFLSPSTRDTLNARLRRFQHLTGNQVVVWIGQSTGDRSLDDWATETFKAWGIGQKGKDNGLALFILTKDKKIRIEVGYGLEGKVTDLLSFRVIHDILQPGFKSGQQNKAVSDAVTTGSGGEAIGVIRVIAYEDPGNA